MKMETTIYRVESLLQTRCLECGGTADYPGETGKKGQRAKHRKGMGRRKGMVGGPLNPKGSSRAEEKELKEPLDEREKGGRRLG